MFLQAYKSSFKAYEIPSPASLFLLRLLRNAMMFVTAVLLFQLSLLPSTFSQDPTLASDKKDYPDAWFYTSQCSSLAYDLILTRRPDNDCSGETYSKVFTFDAKKENKCHKLKQRTAVLVYPDPDPGNTPNAGCFFMYKTDNCSENKDGEHAQDVKAFTVEYRTL